MKVLGKNVVVLAKQGSEWVLYACATSATLNVTTDIIETSVSGNGRFKSFLPTADSFTGTLEGVTSFEPDGKLSLQDLRKKQIDHELLRIKFQRSVDPENVYSEEASFYITSSSDVGSYDGMNNFTIEMQGTGILSVGDNQIDPPVTFDYYYGFGQLSTINTGDPETLPVEADYADTVNDAFDAEDYQTGTAVTGANIIIDDFGNTSDKCVFLNYPKTESKFIYWDEEDNPLQQNQPIDQEFVLGSDNVFFISERASVFGIVSYSQTSFNGKITFHR